MRIPLEFTCCGCGKETEDIVGEICTHIDCDHQQGDSVGLCEDCLEDMADLPQECTYLE